MGIISWIIFGLIAGVIAKVIMPGKDPGGWIISILLGVGGAFIGGFLGTKLGFGSVNGFDLKSFVIAIAGALIILGAYRMIKKA